MSRSIIDTEQIAGAAGNIQRLSGSIANDVRALKGQLASLGGAWEGPARAEFDRVMHEYEVLQTRVNDTLADISTLTSRASTAYAQHEDQTRALFAR